MDYIESFNWKKKNSNPVKFGLKFSYALSLMESDLVPFPENEYKIQTSSELEEQTAKYHVPGMDEIPHVLYPKPSRLTKQQQTLMYKFYCRSKFKNNPLDENEVLALKDLETTARLDRVEFHDFVQQQWIKHHYFRSIKILPQIENYINKLWQMRARQCLTLYPHFYKRSVCIPLALNDPNDNYTVMDFCKKISIKGKPKRMILPTLKKGHYLMTDFNSLCQMKPIESEPASVLPVFEPITPASMDQNVDPILEKENIDVVITSSGIKTIVDYRLNDDWYLPVTVKNVVKLDGSVKKIVIIDKNLPPPAMNSHEKNVWHAKIASKWVLFSNEHTHVLGDEQQDSDRICTAKKLYVGRGGEIEQTKTMVRSLLLKESDKTKLSNTENLTKSTLPISSNKEKRSLTSYDDLITDNVKNHNVVSGKKVGHEDIILPNICAIKKEECINQVDNLEDGEVIENVEKTKVKTCSNGFDYYPEIKPAKQEIRSQHKRKISSTFIEGMPSSSNTNSSAHLLPREEGPLVPCLVYKLWQLQKSKQFNMSKLEQRALNILVRNRIDGRLFYYDYKGGTSNEVCVSSKLEFQPEYGASVINKSKLVREYVDLYIRQTSKLVRVRSIGHTKEVMLTELKSISDIKECLFGKKIFCHNIFDPLYAVLTKLIDLPVGKYMLQHTSALGNFVQLLVECDSGTDFSLPYYCYELRSKDINVPADPIDPYTLTALHHYMKLPPAIFHPTYGKPSIFFKKFQPRQSKKKKKKKKALKE